MSKDRSIQAREVLYFREFHFPLQVFWAGGIDTGIMICDRERVTVTGLLSNMT